MATGNRAALYVRVSTQDQQVANQFPDLERFAAGRDWRIVQTFTDDGISGSKEHRPGLDALRAAAARDEFDVVLIWRIDRVARSAFHLLKLHAELEALGVALVSVTEGIDPTTPSGKLHLTVLAAVAEMERSVIIQRTKAGLETAKRNGKRLGRRPVQFNAHKAQELRQAGHSDRAIAKLLNVSHPTVAKHLQTEAA